jgi:PRA1 family protein 1
MAEVFDFTAISKPGNMPELTGRLRKNASYFRTNYALATAGTTALVMLLNPWSIIVLAILGAVWFYMYIVKTSPLVLGGREFSDREKFALLAGVSLFTVFFLTSVGATIFYALGLSAIMVGIHAAVRVPDDTTLFADDVPGENGSLTGLLSMFKPRNALATYATATAAAV